MLLTPPRQTYRTPRTSADQALIVGGRGSAVNQWLITLLRGQSDSGEALEIPLAMDTLPLYGVTVSLEFAQRLIKRGHESSVCTSSVTMNGDYRNFGSVAGVPVSLCPHWTYGRSPTSLRRRPSPL